MPEIKLPEGQREKIIANCQRALATEFGRPAKFWLSLYGSELGLSGDQMSKLLRSLIPD